MMNELIGCDEAGTLWGLFRERVRRSPQAVAYREYDSILQTWRAHTWQAITERTDRMRAALARLRLKTGDRVAILLPNGTDWVCFDLAALSLGLVVVALYPHDSPANNAYIVGHSDARLLLLDTPAQWQSLAAHHSEFRHLSRCGSAMARRHQPKQRILFLSSILTTSSRTGAACRQMMIPFGSCQP
jgi:long-chain acyl-CoA synthetase